MGVPQAAHTWRAVKSKARLVKEGTLTMIVYGDDERLLWQKRIAQFRGAVR